jgi:hypothetical protein
MEIATNQMSFGGSLVVQVLIKRFQGHDDVTFPTSTFTFLHSFWC